MQVYVTSKKQPEVGIFNPKILNLGLDCEETSFFLSFFNETKGSRIIEIGSNDESSKICQTLANYGFDLTAIDLRKTNRPDDTGYKYIESDFCDLPNDFLVDNLGKIDCIYSISSIEHFGLKCCWDTWRNKEYDTLAMRTAWLLLKPKGTIYVSVPFGYKFQVCPGSWRIYNLAALRDRIVQDFHVEMFSFFYSGNCKKRGKSVSLTQAIMDNTSDLPYLTVFLKMRKLNKDQMDCDSFIKYCQGIVQTNG